MWSSCCEVFFKLFCGGKGGGCVCGHIAYVRECMRKLDFVYVGGKWLDGVRGETKTRKEKKNK